MSFTGNCVYCLPSCVVCYDVGPCVFTTLCVLRRCNHRAKDWVSNKLSFEKSVKLSLFEVWHYYFTRPVCTLPVCARCQCVHAASVCTVPVCARCQCVHAASVCTTSVCTTSVCTTNWHHSFASPVHATSTHCTDQHSCAGGLAVSTRRVWRGCVFAARGGAGRQAHAGLQQYHRCDY